MQLMIDTFGEGAKIPMVDIGMGIIFFTIYISPRQYPGYTGTSNDPALGNFSFRTEWINFTNMSEEKLAKWSNLHGKVLFVKMKASTFAIDGGIVEFELTLKDYSTGVQTLEILSFVAENCKGWSLLGEEVNFKCQLFQLENA